jgi:hypothetical protein
LFTHGAAELSRADQALGDELFAEPGAMVLRGSRCGVEFRLSDDGRFDQQLTEWRDAYRYLGFDDSATLDTEGKLLMARLLDDQGSVPALLSSPGQKLCDWSLSEAARLCRHDSLC